jgi:methylmalonyl-CoA mutase cobalamin-binding domain/chain
MKTDKNLTEALADFDEEKVISMVETRLAGLESPLALLGELQEGMRLVGDRFNRGDYYLSELMLSADLFSRVMQVLEPALEGTTSEPLGRLVIGTPKGDIHDLGKNIFVTLAKAAGFDVLDLGVDVPAERFIQAVEDFKPHILGMSALITTSFETMKRIVDQLEAKGLRDSLKIVVGGGVTTDTVKRHIGADAQTIDAMEGLRLCRELLGPRAEEG